MPWARRRRWCAAASRLPGVERRSSAVMRVGGRGGDGENLSFVVDGVLVVVALVGSEQAGRRGFVEWQVAPGRRVEYFRTGRVQEAQRVR